MIKINTSILMPVQKKMPTDYTERFSKNAKNTDFASQLDSTRVECVNSV